MTVLPAGTRRSVALLATVRRSRSVARVNSGVLRNASMRTSRRVTLRDARGRWRRISSTTRGWVIRAADCTGAPRRLSFAERRLQVAHVLLGLGEEGPQRLGDVGEAEVVGLLYALAVPLELAGLELEVGE